MSMLTDLKGKVALITGSSSGIGAETAEFFAKNGCSVVLTGRNKTALDAVKAKCVAAGLTDNQVLIMPGEVTDEKYIESLVEGTIKHFGKLNILVNNAGAMTIKSLEASAMSDFDEMMNINLRSVVQLSQLCVPHLINTKGAVVIVSSIAGIKPTPMLFHYSIAKAGVTQFGQCLAMELADKGVRVNIVSPGLVLTNLVRDEAMRKVIHSFTQTIPLGIAGQPIDIAKLIAYLSSDDSRFTTGGNYVIDGGSSLSMASGSKAQAE